MKAHLDDKWYVCGDFRMGKSTFCKSLIRAAPSAMVWDPLWEYDDATGATEVWQPRDMEKDFPRFCREACQREDTLVVVDEPALVLDARSTPPLAWDMLWRLGHKRGVGVVVATHRPTGDLPVLARVVHHWVCFRLTNWSDREAVSKLLGPEASAWLSSAKPYHWWHHGTDHQGPMPPLPKPGD